MPDRRALKFGAGCAAVLALLGSSAWGAQPSTPTTSAGVPMQDPYNGILAGAHDANTGALVSYLAGTFNNPAGPVQSINLAQTVTVKSASAAVNSLVILNTPNPLVSFQVVADSTLSASDWYVWVINATSKPADGALIAANCFPVQAGNPVFSAYYGPQGKSFTSGVVVEVSTTGCSSITASAHAYIVGEHL